MPICSTCKKEVDDIRPQIDGVGVCFKCSDRPMTEEALALWKKKRGKDFYSHENVRLRSGAADILECQVCGFETVDESDMIRHLSCSQKHIEENCSRQVIKIKEMS